MLRPFYAIILTILSLSVLSGCTLRDITKDHIYGLFNAPSSSKGTYQVKKGDTIYGISLKHNVKMDSLIALNRLSPPYILHIGQKLKLPMAVSHIVRRGETLSSIAKKYNVSVKDLAQKNKIRNPRLLRVGQRLYMPGQMDAVASRSYSPPKNQVRGNTPKPSSQSKRTATRKRPSSPIVASANVPASVTKISLPTARSGKGFLWPTRGKVISYYGPKKNGLKNDGINIKTKDGQKVVAAENGVVAYSGNELKGFGNLLLVKHKGGWVTAYAHNKKLIVKRGDHVKRGQHIAYSGKTGSVSTPQLHFEIRKGTKAVNPTKYLKRK